MGDGGVSLQQNFFLLQAVFNALCAGDDYTLVGTGLLLKISRSALGNNFLYFAVRLDNGEFVGANFEGALAHIDVADVDTLVSFVHRAV